MALLTDRSSDEVILGVTSLSGNMCSLISPLSARCLFAPSLFGSPAQKRTKTFLLYPEELHAKAFILPRLCAALGNQQGC